MTWPIYIYIYIYIYVYIWVYVMIHLYVWISIYKTYIRGITETSGSSHSYIAIVFRISRNIRKWNRCISEQYNLKQGHTKHVNPSWPDRDANWLREYQPWLLISPRVTKTATDIICVYVSYIYMNLCIYHNRWRCERWKHRFMRLI